MLRDERLELGDELAAAAQLEVGVDPLLERLEPELLEPADLALRRTVSNAKSASGGPRQSASASRSSCDRCSRGSALRASATSRSKRPRSSCVGLDREHVAGRPRDEDVSAPSTLAELRDEVLERRDRRLRRLLAPELVDEAIGRRRTSPAWIRSRPSSARCFWPPSATGPSSPTTSSGPRIRNSCMCAVVTRSRRVSGQLTAVGTSPDCASAYGSTATLNAEHRCEHAESTRGESRDDEPPRRDLRAGCVEAARGRSPDVEPMSMGISSCLASPGSLVSPAESAQDEEGR